ncbi:unnamed protein product [Owenia fusiformis]|uniref:Ammonium transporter n=1 Tax=Owenia fusiformis TaxID=6347 RepID=A0A8J1XIJ0_OWEFU|nr:unnamed protein product [Owenia fusiformis]
MASLNASELLAKIEGLTQRVVAAEEANVSLMENTDQFFLITMGIICYLMQGGFALFEAGSVRSKNITNILIKNLLDSFVGCIAYWLVGYALAYGKGNFFCGTEWWAFYGMPSSRYSHWWFQYVFAATAATIVSGSLAERCDFRAYLIYSFVITGVVYPIVSHWAWDPNGWLLQGFNATDENGEVFKAEYFDFAGSGAVHTLSGVAALCGSAILGPRIGRFDENGKPVDIRGHSIPMIACGVFILLFGFFAFNGGSNLAISKPGDADVVSIAVLNTINGGSFGCMVVLISTRLYTGKWSLLSAINGCLAGMVSVCSGCCCVRMWSGAVMGAIGGFVCMFTSWLMVKVKVDDPVDAIAVHAGAGIWGLIAAQLFEADVGVLYTFNRRAFIKLAWGLTGLCAIIAWTVLCCGSMFGLLRAFGILRVPREIELKGLDVSKHNEPAYPAASYGDGWGSKNHMDIIESRHENGSNDELIGIDNVALDTTAREETTTHRL